MDSLDKLSNFIEADNIGAIKLNASIDALPGTFMVSRLTKLQGSYCHSIQNRPDTV